MLKPTSHMIIDSSKVDPEALSRLEGILYGRNGEPARLPYPSEVLAIINGSPTDPPTDPSDGFVEDADIPGLYHYYGDKMTETHPESHLYDYHGDLLTENPDNPGLYIIGGADD